jgi:alpha-L-fucosidase
MKIIFVAVLILAALVAVSCSEQGAPEPYGPVPSERQLAWHDMQYYMFVHFTVNTFTDKEWGFGDEPESLFNPSELDCSQWAKAAKEAGMKGIIITAKHHDGFCLWPSPFTTHSVKNSPWKEGRGDVIFELQKACQENGLKLGVYLSPWDRNSALYGTPEYITYYRNQLHELLAKYGDIFEVWFDGANGGDGYYGGAREERKIDRKSYYDWPGTHKIVRDAQPMAVMFSDAGPDVRWVGNEGGKGSVTNWSLLRKDELYPGGDFASILGEGHEDGSHWVPAEVDVSIRPGWFYHQKEDTLVKSPEELLDIWYASVGNNCNLLLNVPPDRRGLLHEKDVESLLGLKKLLEAEFGNEVAKGKPALAEKVRGKLFSASNVNDGNSETYWATKDNSKEASVVIDLGGETEINRVLVQEYIKLGQRITGFRFEIFQNNNWTEVLSGTTVGYKIIRKFPTVKTSRVRFTVTGAKASPCISNIELFRAPGL